MLLPIDYEGWWLGKFSLIRIWPIEIITELFFVALRSEIRRMRIMKLILIPTNWNLEKLKVFV